MNTSRKKKQIKQDVLDKKKAPVNKEAELRSYRTQDGTSYVGPGRSVARETWVLTGLNETERSPD